MPTKCKQCSKKIGFCGIHCKYCLNDFCSGCIQLEIHRCAGIAKKKEEEISNLEKKLPLVESKKHGFVC
jgi:hypothetical protein